MTERRRGLGRGLGALIPTGPLDRQVGERPVDVFFPERGQGFTGSSGAASGEQGMGEQGMGEQGPREESSDDQGSGNPSVPGDRPEGDEGGGDQPRDQRAVQDDDGAQHAQPGSERVSDQSSRDRNASRDQDADGISVGEDERAGAAETGDSDADDQWGVTDNRGAGPDLAGDAPAAEAHGSAEDGTLSTPTITSTRDVEPELGHRISSDSPPSSDPAGSSDHGGVNEATGLSEATGQRDHVPAGDAPGRADDRTLSEPMPGTGLLPVPGAQFAEIPVARIVPNPRQPRQVFDDEAMAELVHSIREIGVLQPVVVRPLGTVGPRTGEAVAPSYELVTGERRWRASEQAGLTHVPAIVRETSDDALLRDALLENLHRSDLNPLEEAAAYQQLLDDFGCTHDELAERLGRSRPQVSNTLRLLKLPPLVQRRVAAGVLSAGHARALLGMSDAGAIERLAQRIVAEGLSVRSTEEVVALGDDADGVPKRRRPRQGDRHAALDELATRLSDRLDTRVKIALGQRKGRLTVEFASVDDLNRILGVLAPEEERIL